MPPPSHGPMGSRSFPQKEGGRPRGATHKEIQAIGRMVNCTPNPPYRKSDHSTIRGRAAELGAINAAGGKSKLGTEHLRLAEIEDNRDSERELLASKRRRGAARGKKGDPKGKPAKNDRKTKHRKQGDKGPSRPKAGKSPISRRPPIDTRSVSITPYISLGPSVVSKRQGAISPPKPSNHGAP